MLYDVYIVLYFLLALHASANETMEPFTLSSLDHRGGSGYTPRNKLFTVRVLAVSISGTGSDNSCVHEAPS